MATDPALPGSLALLADDWDPPPPPFLAGRRSIAHPAIAVIGLDPDDEPHHRS